MGKLKSVECRQHSGRSFTNALVTQPEQVFSHYAAADCMRVLPTRTSSRREGVSAIAELSSTKSSGERKRAGSPALAVLAQRSQAVTPTPDFTRLLKGKRVPLLQSRTESCTKDQGFRNLTVPTSILPSRKEKSTELSRLP